MAHDKLKHFMIGYFISLSIALIGFYGIFLTLFIAVAKEVYDKLSGKGTPEILDIVYTVAPAIINYVVFKNF
jgi:hypothetical protein|tara:strand:- start:288 stop:503 length:216 start_codon:yes stop_codon:yes gene_type:complete